MKYLPRTIVPGSTGHRPLLTLPHEHEKMKDSIFMIFEFINLLGLIAFVLLYLLIGLLTYQVLPYYISSFLLRIVLPLTGAVSALIFKNLKGRNQ